MILKKEWIKRYMVVTMDRSLPNNQDIENSIIAGMISEKNCINLVIESGVTSNYFYNKTLGDIFDVIIEMNTEWGTDIDCITLTNALVMKQFPPEIANELFIIDIESKISTTANFNEWIKILKKFHGAREIINQCNKSTSELYSNSKPIKETIQDLNELVNNVTDIVKSKKELTTKDKIRNAVKMLQDLHESGHSAYYVPYCLHGMDNHIYHGKKELHILAASPNIGKTGLYMSIMNARIERGIVDCIFCAESTSEKLMQRLICMRSGLSKSHIEHKMNQTDFEKYTNAVKFFNEKNNNFYVFGKGEYDPTVDGIRAKLLKIQNETNGALQAVAIDYLQNHKPSSKSKSNSIVDDIQDTVFGLNKVFTECNVAGTILCQLNRDKMRDSGNKRPRMYDLKGSSAIEQEADYITFLHRKKDTEGIVNVEWYDDKHRSDKGIHTILEMNTYLGCFNGIGHEFSKQDEPN